MKLCPVCLNLHKNDFFCSKSCAVISKCRDEGFEIMSPLLKRKYLNKPNETMFAGEYREDFIL